MGGIFKFVRNLVNNIMNQVMAQVNMIQDAVTSPLRGWSTRSWVVCGKVKEPTAS
jgi:hypothetical protein